MFAPSAVHPISSNLGGVSHQHTSYKPQSGTVRDMDFSNCLFYKLVDPGFYYSTFYSWLIALGLIGLLLEKYFLLAAYKMSSMVK